MPCSVVDLILEMAMQLNLVDLKPQGEATSQLNSTLTITGTSVQDLQMVMKMLIMVKAAFQCLGNKLSSAREKR